MCHTLPCQVYAVNCYKLNPQMSDCCLLPVYFSLSQSQLLYERIITG